MESDNQPTIVELEADLVRLKAEYALAKSQHEIHERAMECHRRIRWSFIVFIVVLIALCLWSLFGGPYVSPHFATVGAVTQVLYARKKRREADALTLRMLPVD